jgi:polysaccharide biosynthesis transport protein
MPSRSNEGDVSLSKITGVITRRRKTLIVATIMVTAAAAVFALVQSDRYRSDVLMSVEPAAAQAYLKPADASPQVNIQEELWQVRENLYSPAVLEPVISEFHLDAEQPRPAPHWWDGWASSARVTLLETLRALRLRSGQSTTERERNEALLERIKNRIKVEVEAADAFSISFEGNDRTQIVGVTNRLAELLVRHTAHASEQRAGSAAGFLEAEVNRVKASLDDQQQKIQAYQRGATDQLPAQLATNLKMTETLESQLLAKKDQIAEEQAHRAAVSEEMKELATQGVLDAPPPPSPAAAKLQDLRDRLKELQAKYTPEHPEIKSTQAEIANLEKAIAANPTKAANDPSPARLRYMQLKAEQEATDRKLASFQQQQQALIPQIADYQRRVQATPGHERTLAALTRDYDETRAQYQALLDKQNRAQIEERLEQTTQSTMFRIVRPAQFPLEPFAPKRGRIVLLGVFGGLGFGLFLAMFAEYRDTTYKTLDDLRDSTSLPLLAMIPTLPGSPSAGRAKSPGVSKNSLSLRASPSTGPVEQAVTLNDPRSISSEQYGYLSMQVRHQLNEPSSGVVGITSAAGGEGKTLTSINLAAMLARTAPGRVLLVDCDLRKPRVDEYLGISALGGLSDLLVNGETSISSCARRLQQLTVLPAGRSLPNPLDVLCSERTRALFEELRRQFDYIVVDLPPILPIADSQVIGELCDGVMIVVRAQQTRRELLEHALERFPGPNLLGIVLNGVEIKRTHYAQAYEYYAQNYLGQTEGRAASQR